MTQKSDKPDVSEPPVDEHRIPVAQWDEIILADAELRKAQTAEAAIAEKHKNANGRTAACQESLNKLIQQATTGTWQPELPLSPPEKDWRDVALADLAELPIPAAVLRSLRENDPSLETLGELGDFTEKFDLTVIKGIGPAAVEKVTAATDAYWAKHPVEEPAESAQAAD